MSRPKRIYVAIGSIALVAGLTFAPRLNSSAQVTVSWPTFHADQLRDGAAAVTGATSLQKLNIWSLGCTNAGGSPIACINGFSPAVYSSPAIDSKGSAYVGARTGYVYNFDPSGKAKWSFLTGGPVDSSPTLSHDEKTVYVGSDDGNVYALSTTDGHKLWATSLSAPVRASPLLSTDGKTIYVPQINGSLYGLNTADGSIAAGGWPFFPGGAMPGGVAADQSGTILYIEAGNSLYSLPASGPATGNHPQLAGYLSSKGAGTPAVDPNGNIYAGTVNGTLEVFTPGNPTAKWVFTVPNCAGALLSTPGFVRSPSGSYLALVGSCSAGGTGALRAIDTVGGSQVWQVPAGGGVNTSPAVATSNSMIYFGSDDGNLYAIDATGKVIATQNFGAGIDSSPSIAPDGSVWFGTSGGQVFHVGTIPLPATPPPTATATITPIFTSTPTVTPTPIATATPVVVPLTAALAKGTVKPGQKETVAITSSPNTVVHIRVNYPNGDHQSHSVTTSATGAASYSYKQAASKIKHNKRTATVIVTAGTGSAQNTVTKTYTIGFGKIDASAEPRKPAVGGVVDIFVHAKPGTRVVVLLIGPSGLTVTLHGSTGPKGFASIKYRVQKALVTSKKRKVKVVAKFTGGQASTSTNFTVK